MSSHDDHEEALFERSLGLPPEEREAFVRRECGEDMELAERVLSLLRSHESAGEFMDRLPDEDSFAVASRLERVAPGEERSGDQIGRYRLMELIGEGAWGSVWIARQTEDIDRQVALKILKVGLDTKDFLARFEAERQMLAMMDHPNIAHVIDAGSTERGRPYLVMELVKGIQILEFADKNRLGIRERVKLFSKVCRAMHHAHCKGVVHRDLKPSNILVSAQYDEALPKVIDFGVAKSNQLRLTDKTLFTSMHAFVGTPVYSCPEQLEFTGRDVDSRSDIYSLGALLYELVCGATPFDSGAGGREGMAEFVRQVREEDPPRPSQRFSKLSDEEKERIASRRGLSAGRLESLLKEDLDWIAIRCLEKDPALRYDTAKDLADDLQAFMDHQSVTASSPSPFYRMRRFVSRNRPAYAIWVEMTAVVAACFMVAFYYGVKKPNYTSSTPMEISSDSSIQFTDKSIAVLPLDNLSPNESEGYFARAMHEEILSNLDQIDDLFVIGISSVRQYEGTTRTKERIGEELGVRNLLEGSIFWDKSNVGITLKLIEAGTGGQIWAKTYNRSRSELFSIRSEVARDVADQLHAALTPEEIAKVEIRPTENAEVYELYLKSREASWDERIALLETATALDPNYYNAWVSLASSRLSKWRFIKRGTDPELLEAAYDALEKVKQLDGGSGLSLGLQATFVYQVEGDPEKALLLNKKAVSMGASNGGDVALRNLMLGRLELARFHYEEALKKDPLNRTTISRAYWCYVFLREWDRARSLIEEKQQKFEEDISLAYNDLYNILDQQEYYESGDLDRFVRKRVAALESIDDPRARIWEALANRNHRLASEYIEENPDMWLYLLGPPSIYDRGVFIARQTLLSALNWWAMDERDRQLEKAKENREILENTMSKSVLREPAGYSLLAITYALLGDSDKVESLLDEVREIAAEPKRQFRFQALCEVHGAMAYVVLGEHEKAIDSLLAAREMHSPLFVAREAEIWFVFDRLRGNPRFDALINKDEGLRLKAEFNTKLSGESSIGNQLMNTELEVVQSAGEKSIAILPFENLSGREEDELYSKGIHRTLLTRISQLKDLRSIAPSSVMTYRGTDKPLTQIAGELGVAHLLTGDVQILGEAIRINVQLVEAASDRPLWGKTYTRDLTAENFFSIESEIAESIADTLMAVLTPHERDRLVKLPTRNTEALEVFIEGTSVMESAIQTRREEGIDAFRKAIDLDPGFVLAYVNLGRAYLSEASVSVRDKDWWEEAFANAEAAATMALQLDSDSAEAHTLLAEIQLERMSRLGFEGDLDLAKRSLEKALELNPNYAAAYAQQGEFLIKKIDGVAEGGSAAKRLALSWFRKAIDLDPQNHLYRNRLGFLLNELGEFDESREHFEAAVRINPEFAAGIRHLAIQMFSVFGQYDRAISLFRQAVVIDRTRFEPHELQYHCYWTLGDEREAFRWHKAGMGSGIGWNAGGPADKAKYRVAHYQMHDDHERYLEQLRIAVEKSSNWSNYRRFLLNEDMRDGRLRLALQRYEKLFPYLFEEEVLLEQERLAAEGAGTTEPRNQALAAMELAEILVRLGQKDRAYYLLDVAWEFFQRYSERTNWHWFYLYGYGIRDAVRFTLRGEKEEALRAIREAVDEGFQDRLELESSVFDSLRDEPEFEAIMAIVEADWARQLANVRRMEANGELAPIPDEPRYEFETPAKILTEN